MKKTIYTVCNIENNMVEQLSTHSTISKAEQEFKRLLNTHWDIPKELLPVICKQQIAFSKKRTISIVKAYV